MGAGGRTTETDGVEADNVIRFPRDWFGSKEDLIPFGPAADRLEAEQAARVEAGSAAHAGATPTDGVLSDPAADPLAGAAPGPGGAASAALTASDFWGEDAGALHQPMEIAAGAPSGDRAEVNPRGGGRRRRPSRSRARSLPEWPRRRPLAGLLIPPGSAWRSPLRLVACVAAAALVCGGVAMAATGWGGAGHARVSLTAHRAATAESSLPGAPGAHLSAPAVVDRAGGAGSRRAAIETQTTKTTARHRIHRRRPRTSATRRHLLRRRDVDGSAASVRSAVRSVTGAVSSAAPVAAAGPVGTSATSSAGDSGASAGAPVTGGAEATAASGGATSSGAASSGGTTSSGSSSVSSGPGGLGTAVGSNCNPQCSAN